MKKEQVTIFRKSKGQIVVQGPVILIDESGNEIKHRPRFTLCGFTKSKELPFCDGSHKE